MRIVSLGAALFAFWLALSGHYTAFLVTVGAFSAGLCTLLAIRLRILDDAHAVHLLPRALTYWPWLVWEVLKSALVVTRIVLHPRLPISPTLFFVKPSQKTPVGLATYANSITLTPGTLTVSLENGTFLVHALSRDGADDLESGRMDARVRRFEGEA
jgi:multicomponent Na+:H+ antiporter subunit E